jgi:hypothetical protein
MMARRERSQHLPLMTKRKILHDAINVGCTEELCVAQPTATFGTLALKQMAFARTMEDNFSAACDFETFGY